VIDKESGDTSPHSQTVDCDELRVVFEWHGDRYGHRIEQQMGGEWCTVLESLEGSGDENWPSSPVLQSLHCEHRDSGPVALLVGKSGTSHWAASVESINCEAAFEFDIACRIHRSPQWLGSAYRTATSRAASVGVETHAHEAIREQARPNEWRIRPARLAVVYPSTIRWRYRVALNIPEPR
jgi:hypothetical protein